MTAKDEMAGERDVLAEALAEGLHKAMCYGPTTMHNRLACERPAVYLNLAKAAVEHPAVAALAARGYTLSRSVKRLPATEGSARDGE